MFSRDNVIEQVREKEFQNIKGAEKEFFDRINKEFKCISSSLTVNYRNKIILDLFELILYINYKGSSVVITKCDIDKRIVSSRNRYSTSAKKLLTCIYEVRNAFAHNFYSIESYTAVLEEVLCKFRNIEELNQSLKLIMQHAYPVNVQNIYYLVFRENNPEYDDLINVIRDIMENYELPSDDRTVEVAMNRLVDKYTNEIIQCAMLDYLRSKSLVNNSSE